jgi:hypothetical protein
MAVKAIAFRTAARLDHDTIAPRPLICRWMRDAGGQLVCRWMRDDAIPAATDCVVPFRRRRKPQHAGG